MDPLESLIDALDERNITKRIRDPHDQARNSFLLKTNTVRDFDEFARVIRDYYNHHYRACVAPGSDLSPEVAEGRAKEILERDYRRRGGNIVAAYQDAHRGRNNGLRGIVDKLADALKSEAIEHYIRHQFDQHVKPSEWDQKVRIIRQFLTKFNNVLGNTMRPDQAEEYAVNYEPLIRGFVAHVDQFTSDMMGK